MVGNSTTVRLSFQSRETYLKNTTKLISYIHDVAYPKTTIVGGGVYNNREIYKNLTTALINENISRIE